MSGYKTLLVNQSKYDKLLKKLQGCPSCEYEEADGGLFSHCKTCQFDITSLTYELLIDSRTQLAVANELRRASMSGEEPIRSAAVDPSEADKTIVKLTLSLDTTKMQMDLKHLADVLSREFPIR
jgi:hypothetical protein